jgi:ABC-type polysaccharide/polyol phosphate transport system ATPase subunit
VSEALRVDGVSVTFRQYVDTTPTLRRAIGRGRLREATYLEALKDVTFTVDRGEAFGVIGRNGAGKSTLLRVMAGTLRPNAGTVTRFGRTSTLLQLGVGFNPQLSGRENIYLGGLAAGLRRKEIDEKFEGIVAYAELEEAIDRPVRTYSSGMFSRLAFSVSMSLEPEILLLDEVLAVGDEGFREKSIATMKGLLERAGTIVFVSHSLPQVAEFCDRAMWLRDGKVETIGEAGEVADAYKAWAHGARPPQ